MKKFKLKSPLTDKNTRATVSVEADHRSRSKKKTPVATHKKIPVATELSGRGNLLFIIIMRVSPNVSIRREMNFYDKNTCWGKEGISEQNLFSQNTSLGPFYRPSAGGDRIFFLGRDQ